MANKPYRHDGGAGSAWVKQVGQRLEWVRDAVGLNQTELARLIQCDQSTWSGYEGGDRLISIQIARKVCSTFGLTLDFIYEGRLSSEVRQDLAVRLAAAHPEIVDRAAPEQAHRAKAMAQVS